MLNEFNEISKILSSINIMIECEEWQFYNNLGLKNKNIIWIDTIPSKVDEATKRGVPNVYNVVITDKDVVFNVSNNGQSSSVLEFGTHSQEHPEVVYVDRIYQKSVNKYDTSWLEWCFTYTSNINMQCSKIY